MSQKRKDPPPDPSLLLLSPEDEDLRSLYWNLNEDGYARLGSHRFGFVMIHRIVANRMGILSNVKMRIDHINRNKLDNRRENLRLIDSKTNRINSDYYDHASGITQVKSGKWVARIMFNGQAYNLGTFATEGQARKVFLDSRAAGKPISFKRVWKGYYWRKDLKKWQAYIDTKEGRKQLGIFDTEEEAGDARAKGEKTWAHLRKNA